MSDTFDDIVASLRDCGAELAAEAVAADAEAGIIRPGAVVVCLMDLPFGPDEHEPMVRGVYGSFHEAAAEAFLHECQRLEIPREDVTIVAPTWEEFSRAGGSSPIAAARYVCADHDGARVLALILGVLRG